MDFVSRWSKALDTIFLPTSMRLCGISKILRSVSTFLLIFLMILAQTSPPVFAQQASGVNEGGIASSTAHPLIENTSEVLVGSVEESGSVEEFLLEQPMSSNSTESSSSNTSYTSDREPVRNSYFPNVDTLTGAMTTLYPIYTPPGRNNAEPNIALSYNSQDRSNTSLVGYGWSLSIPYITRVNRYGLESVYADNTFYSSLSGELKAVSLTDATHGEYGSENEIGEFLSYEYNTDEQWVVTTLSGEIYTFGLSSSSRQADPNNGSKIFMWMLEEVRDANGNVVSYEYVNDANQLYPSTVTYSHGGGAQNGIYEVEFLRESRPDAIESYATGFNVSTDYRIHQIVVSINGDWIRKYDLEYSPGENTVRSLLSSITESTKDAQGTVMVLPSTMYSYTTRTEGGSAWQEEYYNSPVDTEDVAAAHRDTGMRVMDVNGDGLDDIVNASEGYVYRVYLNNGDGTGWSAEPNFELPFNASAVSISGIDYGNRFADMNGDLLPDYLIHNSFSESIAVHRNNGTNWEESTSGGAPVSTAKGAKFGDVNGDGLIDFLYAYQGDPDNGVYINEGNSGFVKNSSVIPREFFNSSQGDTGYVVGDINHDGLADIFRNTGCGPGCDDVLINQGDGTWVASTQHPIPVDTTGPLGLWLTDINSDGITDILGCQSTNTSYAGSGAGTWVQSYYPPLDLCSNARLIDINGDGMMDILKKSSQVNLAYVAQGARADMLKHISASTGSSSEISYRSSPEYLDASNNILNQDLPISMYVVDVVTVDDGLGNQSTTNYTYAGGDYFFQDPFDRTFSGFAVVTKTDDLGNITKSYYHQGNGVSGVYGETKDHRSLIGRTYKTEQYDAANNLFRTTYTNWDHEDLGNDRFHVKRAGIVQSQFDGNTSHKDSAIEYTYDVVGNILTETNLGEVIVTDAISGTYTDTGSDKTTTINSYATDSVSGEITNFIAHTETTDQGNTTLAEASFVYDNLSQGLVDTGNLTQSNVWVMGSNYQTTNTTYDTYGNVLTITDDNGNITTYAYDTYNLFPATVTNALSQTTSYTYNYHASQVKTETDPNGAVTEYTYDGLGRVLEIKKPDPENTNNQVVYSTFVYSDASNPRSISETTNLNNSLSSEQVIYIDGFDRSIQTRSSSETTNTYMVVDTVYDSLGRVEKQSLPYFNAGAAHTAATTNTNLYAEYVYDAIGRVIQESSAVGSTSYTYNDWKTVIVDPLNNQKDLLYDARGNLVQVIEYLNSAPYYTNYAYDLLGNLVQITDAEGNVRSFTYDALGNKLTSEDLHAVGDTTYGTHVYTYDDLGNTLTHTNPEGDSVTYSYDDLNRVLTEDSAATAQIDKTYTYDVCTNGTGRLCSVTAVNQTESSGPPASSNLIFNGDAEQALALDQGVEDRWQKNESAGNTIDYTTSNPIEGAQSFSIAKTSGGDARLEQSIFLTGGTTYEIQFTLDNSSDISGTPYLTNFEHGGSWAWQGLWWSEALTPGQSSFTIPFTPSMSGTNRVIFQFNWEGVTQGTTLLDIVVIPDPNGGSQGSGGAANTISITTDNSYDLLGNVIGETKTVDGTIYTTSYAYDRVGNVTTSTEPNGYQTKNTYNSARLLERVETKESGGSFADFITNIDYNPLGQTVLQQNANGTETTHAYDANALYRLTNTVTTSPDNQPSNDPPIANFTATPLSGDAPLVVSFTDTSTPGTNPITSWSWDFENDGAVDATSQHPQHTYVTEGTYTVKLTVSDGSLSDEEIKTGHIVVGSSSGGCGANNLIFNGCAENTISLDGPIEDQWQRAESSGNSVDYTTSSPIEGTQSFLISKSNGSETKLQQSIFLTGGTTYEIQFTLDNSSDISGTPYLTNFEHGGSWAWQGLWWSEALTPGQSSFTIPFTPSMSGTNRVVFEFNWSGATNGETRIDSIKVTDPSQAAASSGEGVVRIAAHVPNTIHVQDLTYTYDAAGNIISIVDASETNTAKTTTYAYDDLYRLTSAAVTNAANGNNGTESYTYNKIGNILTKTDSTGTHTYTYNGDQGTSYANPHAVTSIDSNTYTYDKNGNVLNDGTWTHTWSYDNRLISSDNGSSIVTYTYDHTGQRTSLNNGTNVTQYPSKHYNKDVTNNKETIHVFAGPTNSGTVEIAGGNTGIYTNHTDHLTGSNVIADSVGDVVQVLDYYPYGGERLSEGTDVSQYEYAGYEHDEDVNLHYAGARYYNQDIGRWLSQDPAFLAVGSPQLEQITRLKQQVYLTNPQAFNAYSYTANNPLKYVDQNGEFFGEPGRAFASGQRQVANFFFGQANNSRQNSKHLDAFVLDFLGGIFSAGADVFDPDQKVGTRFIGLGLLSLETVTGGRGKAVTTGVRHGIRGIWSNVTKPVVSRNSGKLFNIVEDMYKPGSIIGNGSTADAIRYTKRTGELVGGSDHVIKGQDTIRGLNKWLNNNPNAAQGDINAAKSILDDVSNALKSN